ncbi:MAG: hypothetical protein IJP88_12355, partial [Synergistaceae bacterium]|nr:hypothetical protein [Synergistaceae bacterium]
LAAKEWEIDAKSLKSEVLSSERGFLGLFGNKLKVEVTPVKPLLHLKATKLANSILNLMSLDAEANLREDGTIEIEGADAADYIIGHYGDALKSIEYLLNLILRDPSFEPRLRIDCCGYRERRTRSLERLAEATARQALDYGRPIRLDPMLSWERWVIHTALKNRDDVRTESVGEPPLRKVVIMPRFDADSGMSNPNYNSNRRGGRFSSDSGRGYGSRRGRFGSRSERGFRGERRSFRASRDFELEDEAERLSGEVFSEGRNFRASRDFIDNSNNNNSELESGEIFNDEFEIKEERGLDLNEPENKNFDELDKELDNARDNFEREEYRPREPRSPRPYFGRSSSRSRYSR